MTRDEYLLHTQLCSLKTILCLHCAAGNLPRQMGSTRAFGRSRYIQGLKVKSAVQAIAQFREDVQKNAVPGDADDVGMAAFMVYRLMVRQATISKNHGYFMPVAVKEGMGWLQATFNIGAGVQNAAGTRELSPTDPVGLARDTQKRPAPVGSWGIPQHDPSSDTGTADDSNPSDPIGSIIEAEMRNKYPDMFAGMDPVDSTDAQQKRTKPIPGAPGPRGPLDTRRPSDVAGDAFSSGYAASRQEAMPGADTALPFVQGSPSLRDQADADPKAPPTFGLNETLNKLSSETGRE
eukprot:COSAG02_NODE_58_length_43613_cov_235.901572_30_plen_292_part_00